MDFHTVLYTISLIIVFIVIVWLTVLPVSISPIRQKLSIHIGLCISIVRLDCCIKLRGLSIEIDLASLRTTHPAIYIGK